MSFDCITLISTGQLHGQLVGEVTSGSNLYLVSGATQQVAQVSGKDFSRKWRQDHTGLELVEETCAAMFVSCPTFHTESAKMIEMLIISCRVLACHHG